MKVDKWNIESFNCSFRKILQAILYFYIYRDVGGGGLYLGVHYKGLAIAGTKQTFFLYLWDLYSKSQHIGNTIRELL